MIGAAKFGCNRDTRNTAEDGRDGDARQTAKRAGKKHGLEADVDAVISKIKFEVAHRNLTEMEDRGS